MAIIKSENMSFQEEKLVMIISGLPGVGKTTLAFSAPDVVLIDFDKGVKRTKAEHRKDIISISSHAELLNDIKSPDFQKYKTVVFDTGGQFIDLLKDWAIDTTPSASKKGGGISLQGFGIVKQEFLRFSNEVRKTHNIIYIFHTLKDKDKDGNIIYDLMCEGATKQTVWIPTDLGAYMEIIGDDRFLNFTPSQEYSAKSSYGIKGKYKIPKLDEGQPNNFLTTLFEMAWENIKEENERFTPQKEQYEKAMAAANEIISKIEDLDSLNKALEEFRGIQHALTSEKEMKAILKLKLSELKIEWNKEAKAYEQK